MKYIALFLILSLVLLGFIKTDHPENYPIEFESDKKYQAFQEKLQALLDISERLKMEPDQWEALQLAHLNARLAYKEVSFLLNFYYPAFVEDHLNGAPLMKVEKYSTASSVHPPEGLQILDEMIFAERLEEPAQINILIRVLTNKSNELKADFSQRNIPIEHGLEAVKLGLIDVFTLSLTGFDTPGSANAIPESLMSIQSMWQLLESHALIRQTSAYHELKHHFEQAIHQLESDQDFEQFDRLGFYRNHLNPIFKGLDAVQNELKLPKKLLFPSGRKLTSVGLFDSDFLDPYFFTELEAQEDSEVIRNLGKSLFYDPDLSSDGQFSCGSCHRPELAFTDGLPKSQSKVLGETVLRNSPTLLNAVYADRYFYDLRAFSLEQQAEHVIFNPEEFDTEYDVILNKLKGKPNYQKAFKSAFKSKEIDRERVTQALASYVLSLQSFDSPFDQYIRSESDDLSESAQQGFNLFMGKGACGTCHFPPTFSGLVPPYFAKNETEILGVLKTPHQLKKTVDSDMGRSENGIHHEQVWIYERSFKTPTIRNVEKTAPYFHNGAYKTLDLVMEFYDHGGGVGIGLEVKNQTLSADSLHLTKVEKNAIIDFMESLTDVSSANE